MSVWQQLYEEIKNRDLDVKLLSVAVDVQGATIVKPFVENAGVEFGTLVDRKNVLGELYQFKAVPNGLLINEDGILDYIYRGGFDIRNRETRRFVTEWVTHGNTNNERQEIEDLNIEHHETTHLFQKGAQLFENGYVVQALRLWNRAIELDPDNYIMRKQVWAIENPERFYKNKVDIDWQRERIKNESSDQS